MPEPKDLRIWLPQRQLTAERQRYRDLKRTHLKLIGQFETLEDSYESAVNDLESIKPPKLDGFEYQMIRRGIVKLLAFFDGLVDTQEASVTEVYTGKANIKKYRRVLKSARAVKRNCATVFSRLKKEER